MVTFKFWIFLALQIIIRQTNIIIYRTILLYRYAHLIIIEIYSLILLSRTIIKNVCDAYLCALFSVRRVLSLYFYYYYIVVLGLGRSRDSW